MSTTLTAKERARVELQQLVAAYDGPIRREPGQRVQVVCGICGARRLIDLRVALRAKVCVKCGSTNVRVAW